MPSNTKAKLILYADGRSDDYTVTTATLALSEK